jgi:hypothetical protein
MKDNRAIKLIAEKLNSENSDEVLFTINQIRNSGDPEILFFLIDLLKRTKNIQVSSAIVGLLMDLKNQAAVEEIISALKNEDLHDIRKTLLTSCWQSGLNYSKYLDFFVELFIVNDFEIAFEALTIIENIEESYPDDMINPIIKKLKSGHIRETGPKKELFIEMVHILENKIL